MRPEDHDTSQNLPQPQTPNDAHPFIAPQLDDGSANKNSLRWWYIRRITVLLVIISVFVGSGVGIYRSINGSGGENEPVVSKTDEQKLYDGDGSDIVDTKDPTREFLCPDDDYVLSEIDESVCERNSPEKRDLIKSYSCPSGYTTFNSDKDTKCEKSMGGRTLTTAASKSYVCPSGYTRAGTQCTQTSTRAASVAKTCSSGYTLSGSGSSARCSKTTTSSGAVQSSCASGYVKSGTGAKAVCRRTVKPNSKGKCPSGYKKVSKTKCVRTVAAALSCQSGYIKSGSGTSTKCTKYTTTYVSPSLSYSCSSGYTRSGTACSKTVKRAASVNYSCPGGYGRSNSTCIRYENGSVQTAKPIVKSSCPKDYEMTVEKTACQKTAKETVEAEVILHCEDDWELLKDDKIGSKCVVRKD
ncbi:MAG TPA: hypothetical protein VGE34_04530 [Candidatus Saccharimonadales bacterium]